MEDSNVSPEVVGEDANGEDGGNQHEHRDAQEEERVWR